MLRITICLFLFCSCSNGVKITNVAGNYKSKIYSRVESMIGQLRGQTHVLHSELKLHADSTYIHITCGNIISGTWRVLEGDTLDLFCSANRFRNDSINKIKIASCGTVPEKYFIENDGELYRVLKYEDKEILDCFIKE